MPARDIYHNNVKSALIKDGWAITHDPLRLEWGGKDMFVDLGAEQLIGAQRAGRKIAIEVKSFVGRSDVDDLEKALVSTFCTTMCWPRRNRTESSTWPFTSLSLATCLKGRSGTYC
jgi:hypothetical protein